jgi:hypothetical protein
MYSAQQMANPSSLALLCFIHEQMVSAKRSNILLVLLAVSLSLPFKEAAGLLCLTGDPPGSALQPTCPHCEHSLAEDVGASEPSTESPHQQVGQACMARANPG